MKEWYQRRWLLLLFSTTVAGTTGRNSVEFARAVDCYHARRYSEARDYFESVARERGHDAETDFYLGRLALWFDDGESALQHLERAARTAPNDPRIQNALGDAFGLAAQNAHILGKFGWARKCLAAYTRATELDPQNVAWRWSLVGYHCVAPGIAGGDLRKAREQTRIIASLDAAGGRVAQATLLLVEKKHEAAFAIFDQVLKTSPDDFVALYHIGRCAAISGQHIDRGIAALRRCLDLPAPAGDGIPTLACVQYRLGNLLEKKNDEIGARAAYAAVEREQPDFRGEKIALKN